MAIVHCGRIATPDGDFTPGSDMHSIDPNYFPTGIARTCGARRADHPKMLGRAARAAPLQARAAERARPPRGLHYRAAADTLIFRKGTIFRRLSATNRSRETAPEATAQHTHIMRLAMPVNTMLVNKEPAVLRRPRTGARPLRRAVSAARLRS